MERLPKSYGNFGVFMPFHLGIFMLFCFHHPIATILSMGTFACREISVGTLMI